MTACDQDEKYRLARGRPGSTAPATIFMRLLVAIPLPYREYKMVDWSRQLGSRRTGAMRELTNGAMNAPTDRAMM